MPPDNVDDNRRNAKTSVNNASYSMMLSRHHYLGGFGIPFAALNLHGKPASQSTTHLPSRFGPAKALDGSLETFSHTGKGEIIWPNVFAQHSSNVMSNHGSWLKLGIT